MRIQLALAAALLPLTSCGLIDSDIADFDLSLPRREVVLDTAQWEVMGDQGRFPTHPCAQAPSECQVLSQCSEVNCFPSCDGTNCKVTVQVALWNMFDLLNEKPELAEIEDQPIVEVTIDRIVYDVTENTMNMATPELTVYLGPATVMSPGDPQARAIGTIASIAPGQTVQDGQLVLSADAQEIVKDYLKDFRTPFNLIVGGMVDIEAGDPLPEGRLVAVIQVEAHAGL